MSEDKASKSSDAFSDDEQRFQAIERRLAEVEMLINDVRVAFDKPFLGEPRQERIQEELIEVQHPAGIPSVPEAAEAIVKALEGGKRLTGEELIEATGLSKTRFRKARRLLHSENRVVHDGNRITHEQRYFLTDEKTQ